MFFFLIFFISYTSIFVTSEPGDNNVSIVYQCHNYPEQALNVFKQELMAEIKEIIEKTFNKRATVKQLLGYGENCTIMNWGFYEYLRVSDRYVFGRRHQVFTRDNDVMPLFWNFERYGSYSKAKYRIKNVENEEYLYAVEDALKYDTHRRRVFTQKFNKLHEDQYYWDIQVMKQDRYDDVIYMTIRNVMFGEYFYAVDDENRDTEQRQVLTWKYDVTHDIENDHRSHWVIKCE